MASKSRDSSLSRGALDLTVVSTEFKTLQAFAAEAFPELARSGTELRTAKEACQTLVAYLRTVITKLREVRTLTQEQELGNSYFQLKELQDSTVGKLSDAIGALRKQCEEMKRGARAEDFIPSKLPSSEDSLRDKEREIQKLKAKLRAFTSKVSTANEDFWKSKALRYKDRILSHQAEPMIQIWRQDDLLDLVQVQAKAIETSLDQRNEGRLRTTAAGERESRSEDKVTRLTSEIAEMTQNESQLQQLIEQLDQQNKDLYTNIGTKEKEIAYLQEQVKRLQRETTPKKTPKQVYLTPKKRAAFEEINELIFAGEIELAAISWKEVEYMPVQSEAVERNYDMLREVLRFRDRQIEKLENEVKAKAVDLKLAEQRMETNLREKDGELELLKQSLGASDPTEGESDPSFLSQRLVHMEEALKGKDGHIAILIEQCDSLNSQLAAAHTKVTDLESKVSRLSAQHKSTDSNAEDALIAKQKETETLLHQYSEAKAEIEGLRREVVRLEDQLVSRGTNTQVAYVTRLEAELKVLKTQMGDPSNLKELIQRVVSRSEKTMEGMEKEIKELQAQVEAKVTERVAKQLEAISTYTAQETQLKNYVEKLEREGQFKQATIETLTMEVGRLKSLFDDERAAHSATLKLLKGGNPSIMELEQQREDYLSAIETTLSGEIQKLSNRIDILQHEIIKKNSEVKDLERKYDRDTAELAEKLKEEHSRKLEIATLYKDLKSEMEKTRDQMALTATAMSRKEDESVKQALDKMRDAEDAVLQQNQKIFELEGVVREKEAAVGQMKEEKLTIRRKLEETERKLAVLQNRLQDLDRSPDFPDISFPRHNKPSPDQLESDLHRFELENQRLRTEIDDMKTHYRDEPDKKPGQLASILGFDSGTAEDTTRKHDPDIERLTMALQNAESRVRDLQDRLAVRDRGKSKGEESEIGLRAYKEKVEIELRAKARDIGALTAQVELLTDTLTAKDKEIASAKLINEKLKSQLEIRQAGKSAELQSLSAQIEEKSNFIRQLNQQIDSLTNELRRAKDDRDTKIAVLKGQITDLQRGKSVDITISSQEDVPRTQQKASITLESLIDFLESQYGEWMAMAPGLRDTRAVGSRSRKGEDLADRVVAVKQMMTSLTNEIKRAVQRPQEDGDARLEASISQAREVLGRLESSHIDSEKPLIAQLVSSNLNLEKELLARSQSSLRDDGLLKTLLASKGVSASEMTSKLALQRWQEAEQEVYKLRSRLVEATSRLEKIYRDKDEEQRITHAEELQSLRKRLEDGTQQIMTLQDTVQSLQGQKENKGKDAVGMELARIKGEIAKYAAAAKIMEETTAKAQSEARKAANQVQRLQDDLQRKDDLFRSSIEKFYQQLQQLSKAEKAFNTSLAPDPVTALDQITGQLWTWLRLTQLETEKRTRSDSDVESFKKRWGAQETDYMRQISALETEKSALVAKVDQAKAEIRAAKSELESARSQAISRDDPPPRRRDSRSSYDVDLYERGRLVGINEGRKEREDQFDSERLKLQQMAKRYSDSLDDLQLKYQSLQEKYIAVIKEPKYETVAAQGGSRLEAIQRMEELASLRREKEESEEQWRRIEGELKEALRRKDEELAGVRRDKEDSGKPPRSFMSTPMRSNSPARRVMSEDAIKLELLNRRSAALKEIQDCERSNKIVDPAMRAYVRELNSALTKYS